MLIKTSQDVYKLTSFSNFKDLVCGFSTTSTGDIRNTTSKEKFLKKLGIEKSDLVSCQQIHSGGVKFVNKKDLGRKIKNTDGFLTKENNLFLIILVADCLPIVAFDPRKKIIGLAHAGWRGTLKGIGTNLVKEFIIQGSSPEDIVIGFGPGIEFCHYEVGSDVANKFRNAGYAKAVVESISGKTHLDLKLANSQQLQRAGILRSNLDTRLRNCTYESGEFYSYRAGDKGKRIAGIIGITDGK